ATYSRPQQKCWGLFACAVLFWSATNESRKPGRPATYLESLVLRLGFRRFRSPLLTQRASCV
ncbi:hypothetical protein, partial [Vibrio europaeus]|uniref:hypothetical protein n=1 Tax=Vibrio europaeus TaxID=300876 RepID=UPI00233E9A78